MTVHRYTGSQFSHPISEVRLGTIALLATIGIWAGGCGKEGRPPESGVPEAEPGAAFVEELRGAWAAQAEDLRSLSGIVRVTIVPPEGSAKNLLAVVKYRAPLDVRLVLMADFVTILDALVRGQDLSIYVPFVQKAYRGTVPSGASPADALPELSGTNWLSDATSLRGAMAGVAVLPSESGRVTTQRVSRSDSDWAVTVSDSHGVPERRYFVRASDHAIARAEFLVGGRVRTVMDARDFRSDGRWMRAYRQTYSTADGNGRAVLQFQEMKRNAPQDPKVYVHDLPSEVVVAPLDQILSDRKKWEEQLRGEMR